MELEEQKIKIRKYIIIGTLSILIILFITALFKMASKDKIKSSNFIKSSLLGIKEDVSNIASVCSLVNLLPSILFEL